MSALREDYRSAFDSVWKVVDLPAGVRWVLEAALATGNSVTALVGTYGVGKTTLAMAVMRALFSDLLSSGVLPVARFRETLTEFDVFWYVNVAAMQRGDEEREVTPRPIVTAPFKFINEASRGSPRLYQALLSLLAEGEMEYRGRVYRSARFVALLDVNPADTASVEMPRALLDRIDASVQFPSAGPVSLIRILRSRLARALERAYEGVEPVLDSQDMARVWEETARVRVPDRCLMLLALVHASMMCAIGVRMPFSDEEVEIDRSLVHPSFRLPCETCSYRGHLCSRLEEVWGIRWSISAARLASSRAWLLGRREANLGDVLAVVPFTLAHRVQLREQTAYPSAMAFLERFIPEMIRTSGEDWVTAVRLWRRLAAGDGEALDALRAIADRNPAVAVLLRELRREAA